MVACSFAKKEMAAAIVRSCSLLLSWMMASRPSCRDFSLIRWDLVFLLSKVLTTLQCTATSKQVGSCAWRTQTAKFSSPAAQTRRPSARQNGQPTTCTSETARNYDARRPRKLRLQQSRHRQQTKKTKNKPKKTKDAKKKRCAVHHLSL